MGGNEGLEESDDEDKYIRNTRGHPVYHLKRKAIDQCPFLQPVDSHNDVSLIF